MNRTVPVLIALACLIHPQLLRAQPANDICSDAGIFLLMAGSPEIRTGNNEGATNNPPIAAAQVWEAFTITQCMDLVISYCGTTPVFEAMLPTLYTGCTAGGGLQNQVRHPNTGIDQTTCADGNYTIPFMELPAGTYYFPVLSAPGSIGEYMITFTATPCTATPPANDECSDAITLLPGSSCVSVNGDVAGANAGVSIPGINCEGFTGDASDDVWFQFVATAGQHSIRVQPGDLMDAVVDLRSGTCGTTENMACSDMSGAGGIEQINASGLAIGETYYVRVYDRWSGLALGTTFEICLLGPASGDCPIYAGTLNGGGGPICIFDEALTLVATPSGNALVPEGYAITYLLTMGDDMVVEAIGSEAEFNVMEAGEYTIHTFVYAPDSFDISTITLGTTTGADILAQIIQGSGEICGSLDVEGASFELVQCVVCEAIAGTLEPLLPALCLIDGNASLEVIVNTDTVIPDGYAQAFVLTQGAGQVILDVSLTPTFNVSGVGIYTVHSLVYDPMTLDLATITVGSTTAGHLNALLQQGGGTICASLDLAGAIFQVNDCTPDNNLCVFAQPLNIFALDSCAGNETQGTTLFATSSGVEPTCDPASAGYADVWYIFHSGGNDQVIIDVIPAGITGWGMAVYMDCAAGDPVACMVEPDMPMVINTTTNTEYLVMVYTNLQNGQTGDFSICITAEEAVNYCVGGTVSVFPGETAVVICENSPSEALTFLSAGSAAQNYAYILTNGQDVIIEMIIGNSLDMNDAPTGTYHVYGISYNGMLTGATPGMPIMDVGSTGDCVSLSVNHVTISVEICTGISNEIASDWSLYPNPATHEVNFTGSFTGDVSVELIDLSGRIMAMRSLRMNSGERTTLPLTDVVPGMYNVIFTSDDERHTMRLLVE